MESTVERLSPTRVRIKVEVPFKELQPDFNETYKQLAKQVRVKGFRPGKAPAQLIEARFGKEAVLDQVIGNAVPPRYSQAITESELRPLGKPEIEVTERTYGEQIAFTAEVDVRPEFQLPDLAELAVTVEPIEVTEEEVDAELEALRTRFATLTGVDRPAADGDFVSIDLSATVDGEDAPQGKAEGLSHQVGSGRLFEGLDEAVVGISAGETKTFITKLAAGTHAGKDAEVTVTVGAVKERELPDANDEFAQLASEFDTIDELRVNLTDQVRQTKRIRQAEEARQATLDALVERVEMPLPEAVVQAQVDTALHNELHGIGHDENKFAEVLAERGSSRAEFDAKTRSEAEKAVKAQLLLDAIADNRDIQVSQNDITQHLILMARQTGLQPQQLMSYLQQNNQLAAVFADVRRGKSLAAAVLEATVTDNTGAEVDIAEFFTSPEEAQAAEEETDENSVAEGLDQLGRVGEVGEADGDNAAGG